MYQACTTLSGRRACCGPSFVLTFRLTFRLTLLLTLVLAPLLLSHTAHAAQTLPPEALQSLQRAGVPADAMSVVVHDATSGRGVLQWQEQRAVNPASLMKLLTTMAALDRLGPAFTWATPVWLTGPV